MYYFTFNGVESSEFDIWLEREPEIINGNLRAETQTVIGSSKVLHYTEGDDAMDPVGISLDCCVANVDDDTITEILAWLRGSGDLSTDYDPEHFYRAAMITNQIPLARIFRNMRGYKFTVELEAEAHRYHYPAAKTITITEPRMLRNPGTAPAEPLIRLEGSGDVTLMIGSSSLVIDDITDYVMIDCDAQIIYREDVNLGAKLTCLGEWPKIPASGCMINWAGDVESVKITPRWRDY